MSRASVPSQVRTTPTPQCIPFRFEMENPPLIADHKTEQVQYEEEIVLTIL